MSEDMNACVICKEGATPSKRLVNNTAMLTDLLQFCRERVSLGQSDIQQLTDHLIFWSHTHGVLIFWLE